MKKFVYLVMDGNRLVAIYEDVSIAKKLLKAIEAKLELEGLTIEKKQVNPDIKVV